MPILKLLMRNKVSMLLYIVYKKKQKLHLMLHLDQKKLGQKKLLRDQLLRKLSLSTVMHYPIRQLRVSRQSGVEEIVYHSSDLMEIADFILMIGKNIYKMCSELELILIFQELSPTCILSLQLAICLMMSKVIFEVENAEGLVHKG